MNLRILAMLLIYWAFIFLFFGFGANYLTGYATSGNLTDMAVGVNQTIQETTFGGFGAPAMNFGRFLGLALFGVGLPSSTPAWFQILFSTWQSFVTIFTVGFIINSIWSGGGG